MANISYLDSTGLSTFWNKIKALVTAAIQTMGSYTINGKAISSNPTLSKSDVGLGNVTNDAQVKRTEMGAKSGVATLDANGYVPLTQLGNLDTTLYKVVDSLPTSGIVASKIYLMKSGKSGDKNVYSEYIYTGTLPISTSAPYDATKWEKLGDFSAEVDLANYAKLDASNSFKMGQTIKGYICVNGIDRELSFDDIDGFCIADIGRDDAGNETSRVEATYGTRQIVSDGHALDFPASSGTLALDTEATTSAKGLMSATDKSKLDGIAAGANKYTLPTATASALGGVKSSTTGTTVNRDYKVQVNSDGTMKVNVPWTDTNTQVTVDSAMSSTSTNPVQNKVVNTELGKKLSLSGGTMTGNIGMGENSIQFTSTQGTCISIDIHKGLGWKVLASDTMRYFTLPSDTTGTSTLAVRSDFVAITNDEINALS